MSLFFANHLGMRKTKERIRYSFYWPNMPRDIEEYCRFCQACQLKSRERTSDHIPIAPLQRLQFSFEQVTIDIIGPIETPQHDPPGEYLLWVLKGCH